MQIKNVTLSATTETEITIEQGYPYVWFKNLGDNTVYVSASPDILDNGSVKTEGVSTITSGECTSVTTKSDKVYAYALGATIVEVHAQGNPESSFKIKAKGGESSVTVEPILITHNGEYTAPEGKAYSPVNVQTPVYNITPLTLTHNHQGAEAGLYGGYSPVQVDIEMDTLNAPSNGVYEIDTTQDGWDTVLVDTYEKYNVLFFSNATGAGYEAFTDEVTTSTYDELWMTGYYSYVDGGGSHIALWNSRFPTSAVYEFLGRKFGVIGSDNYLWCAPDASGKSITTNEMYGYNYPYMYIGVKNRDGEQDLLWKNSETTTPSSITLSDSIFDYDEICLQFVYIANETFNTTMWFLTSDLSINETIYGYNYVDGEISKYTIAANDTLTVVSESGFRLYAVYGIKDNSMTETTLFTNPSDSTMPATITLSDAYTNYDELVIIGHPVSDTIKGAQYYPVKALGKMLYNSTYDRVGIFTDVTNCWMEITSTTTLVPDGSYSMVVDKIVGIKRPVISTAHELIDVVPLTANSNGTYTAPSGTAYSPVVVDVQEQPWAPLQDGYSNFWFELTDDTLSPWLNFSAKNNDAVIDWGDGSGEVALNTLSPTHTYSKPGRYIVKCKGVTGVARQYTQPLSNSAYQIALKHVELNNEVTTIAAYAFYMAFGLEDVSMTNNLTSIQNNAFAYTPNIKALKISASVTDISISAFRFMLSLFDLKLPDALQTLGGNIQYLQSMETLTIPATVTSIGNDSFVAMENLKYVHMLPTIPPTLGTGCFRSANPNYIIYVPVGTAETYKSASGWSAYSDHILEEGQTPNRAMLSRLAKADMEAEKADDESSDKR